MSGDDDDMAEGLPRPSWRIRRRIILATLIFCAAEVLYLTIWGRDTGLHEALANGVLILSGSVIGAYVFGAVWDDSNVLISHTRPPRRRPRFPQHEGGDAPSPPEGYAE